MLETIMEWMLVIIGGILLLGDKTKKLVKRPRND
jgi:hypothetical protein